MKISRVPFYLILPAILLQLLVGCGRQEESAAVQKATPAPAKTAKVIRLFSWSDYFDPEVLTAFEEETGLKVDYTTFGDLDELEAKLRSKPGHYDVVVTDDASMRELWELRLLREIDHSKLPNFSNVDPSFKGLPFDPENDFSAPYMWGTTLVAYRNDRIEDPDFSWNLLWDESLKGHVMVMQDRLETISVVLMSLGYPLNSEDEGEVEEATAKAIDQITRMDVRYGDDADVRAGLEDGSLWAAMCYSGDAAMVAAENENVSFFIPKEGAPLWIDSFGIARDSENVAEALQLINYMLGAEVAAANSNYTYYASPNKAAVPFIDAELLDDETINPPEEVLVNCEFFVKPSTKREQLTYSAWLKVQKLVRQQERNRSEGEAADAGPTASITP